MKFRAACHSGLFLLCLLAFITQASAQNPVVRKVDPPNWWLGLPSPMILIQGDGLQGASLAANGGIKVKRVHSDSSGRYLFAWLDTRSAKAGAAQIRVNGSGGSTSFSFSVERRSDSKAGFQGFNQDDVIYLIMPDRFADGDPANDRPAGSNGTYDRNQPQAYHGGDLRGVRDHLDYLRDLGVNTIWLTPVWKNANSDYHGYHVVDFYAIDDHMGTLKDYNDLVAEAHKRGMKVLIDYVVNHTGPDHPWVQQPPSPTWFHGTAQKHLPPDYNFAPLTDPHATDALRRGTIQGWFVDRLPDLDTDDPEVAEYLLDNAIWWTESSHLDGFRLDTFPYSSRQFWSEWLPKLQQPYPRTNSIGEVSDGDVTITSFFDGGRTQFDGVDSRVSTIFDYPLYYAIHDVIVKGQPIQRMIDVLQRDWLYPHPENLVTFIDNHDKPRFAGDVAGSQQKIKAAIALLLTLRGIPQVYYGDEIGMLGGDDPDNRRDFPGGFPGDSRNAFTAGGRTPEEGEIFAETQSLLKLRQEHPALRHGAQWHIGWDQSYYSFVRQSAEEKLLVVFNNSPSARDIPIKLENDVLQNARQFEKVFGDGQANKTDAGWAVSAPPVSVSIYQVK
jgi:glycosidase